MTIVWQSQSYLRAILDQHEALLREQQKNIDFSLYFKFLSIMTVEQEVRRIKQAISIFGAIFDILCNICSFKLKIFY